MSTENDLYWSGDPGDEDEGAAAPPRGSSRKAAKKASGTRAPAKKAAPRKSAAKKAAPRKSATKKVAPRAVDLPTELPLHEGAPAWDISVTTPVTSAPTAPARRSRRASGAAWVGGTLLLAALAGFGAAAYDQSRPDTYVSRAQLLIDQQPGLTYAQDDGLLVKLGRLRIKYRDLVTTTTFARDVAKRTGHGAALVHASLSAQADPQSLLLDVTSKSSDRSIPQPVAQAAAEQLSKDVEAAQRREKVPVRARITLTVVSPAPAATTQSSGWHRAVALSLGVALGVLLLVALLRDLVRRQQVVRAEE